ncbi:MAG TPA: hypothetical protein VMT57_09245 [Candidatus Thermoplasmatota archaeon]|nr:hypothetical protein [Candidatus Thermoplasmatota archaeon]
MGQTYDKSGRWHNQWLRFVLVLTLVSLQAGCPFYVPYPIEKTRFTQEEIFFIQQGVTTKSEVTQRLGAEPDIVYYCCIKNNVVSCDLTTENQSCHMTSTAYVYKQMRQIGTCGCCIIILLPTLPPSGKTTGDINPFLISEALIIAFDDADRVSEFMKVWRLDVIDKKYVSESLTKIWKTKKRSDAE